MTAPKIGERHSLASMVLEALADRSKTPEIALKAKKAAERAEHNARLRKSTEDQTAKLIKIINGCRRG